MSSRPSVLVVVSSPMTVDAFLRGHLDALSGQADVHIVGNGLVAQFGHDVGEITVTDLEIRRAVAPIADFIALVSLARLCRRTCPDAVISYTPKAGLVAMIASRLTNVAVRVHTFTGQVWATRTGWSRRLLRALDTVTSRCATLQLVDSRSQRRFLVDEDVLRSGEGEVLGAGSVAGVDVERFGPASMDTLGRATRRSHGIPDDAVVILFVGRLTREKGVFELVDAFAQASEEMPSAWLLVAGPDEGCVADELRRRLGSSASRSTVHAEMVGEPELLYAAADLAVLPSHREGFGVTVLEAAAARVPTVGSRIYGITDAIVDDVTGVLIEVGDPIGLGQALVALATDTLRRQRLGDAARKRVEGSFRSDLVSELLVARLRRALDDARSTRSAV